MGLAACLGALFASGPGLNAQVATTYTFSQSVGTYTPITGGTLVASHTGFAAGVNSMDDQVYNVPSGTIPFAFTYDGNIYTGLNINSNGYITFGATASSASSYTPLSSTTAYTGAVSAFGRDLQGGFAFNATRTLGSADLTLVTATGPLQVGDFVTGTGIPAGATITAISGTTITMSAAATSSATNATFQAGGASWSNIRYETVGTAPSREFVIQWSGFKRFGTTGTAVQHMTLNFQIRLQEAGNNVVVRYGNCSPGLTTLTTVNQVGLRGPNATFATSVNNRQNTKGTNDDWVNSAVGISNTAGMVFNNVAPANVISNGLTYTWTAPAPPACPTPGALTFTGITNNSANVNFLCSGCTGSYIIEYGVAPFNTPGTGATAGAGGTIVTSGSSPGALSTLSAATTYNVYVRQDCGVNGFSANSTVGSFTTLCNVFTIPFTQNFDAVTAPALPTCWAREDLNAGTTWLTASGVAGFTGNVARYPFSSTLPANDWLYTPGLALTGGTSYRVQYTYAAQSASFPEAMDVFYGTSAAAASMTTLIVDHGTFNFTTPSIVFYDFTPATTGTYYIGWHAKSGVDEFNINLDDVSVNLTPSCSNPTALVASNVTFGGADIGFTCSSCTGTYIVEYGVAPFNTPGTGASAGAGGTVVTTATLSATLGSLLANTTYNVYVRQECTPGVLYSVNSTALSFTTPCGPIGAPYAQSFEAYATTASANWPSANCITASPQDNAGAFRWDRSNVGTPSTPTGPNVAFDGSIYAFTEASSGVPGDIANLTLQPIDVSTLSSPALTFYYHMAGPNMGTLNVQASTTGVSYTTVFSLTGPQQSAEADPWLEAFVDLSAYSGGNLYLRFQGVRGSSFEGDMAIDAISVAEAPTCLVPTGLTLTGATASSISASWTAEPNAGAYNWEVRTSGAAGSGAAGLIDAGTTASTSFTSTLTTINTAYQVYVQSDCSANSDGLSVWSGALNVFTGYCTPTTDGNLDPNGITNVTFANIDADMNTELSDGYIDNTALVAGLEAGQVVPLSVLVETGFTYDMNVWIDWNNNFTFDSPAERVAGGVGSESNGVDPWVTSFTVPPAQAPGTYRMRIGGADFGVTGPCFSGSWIAFTDFTISICDPPTDDGTVLVNDNCVAQTFGVSVTADLGSGTTAEIIYSVNGASPDTVAYAPATVIGPFASHVYVDVTVVTNQGCAVDLGRFRSACDIELDCEAPSPIQMLHCYSNGDTQTWTWVNTEVGGTVALKFISGSVETNNNILLWEGAVGGTPATPATLTGNLAGQLITSVGNTLSMSISTDGSNSCADGGAGLGAGWVFQARCGGCVEPQGFVTADPNELGSPEVNCAALPVPTFNAYVGISDNGIDENTGNPPATVGYRLFVNNVAQPDVTGLPGGEFYLLGSFPLGTDLDVILLHEDQTNQSSCNSQVATNFTVGFNACPPANDLCTNAQLLTLNPDGTCPANAITGTTLGADQTGPLPSCQATGTAQDVWYTFNSGVSSTFTMTLTAATAGNIGVELFTACGTPVSGACLANVLPVNNPITITVAPNTNYWLRVFTNVTTGAPGTFNICVSAFDPCLDIQNISACAVSTQATRPAGNGAWTNFGGPFGTPGRERIFTFTPTITGTYTISVTAITGSWVDFFFKESSVGCNTTGWTYIDDINAVGLSTGFTLNAGTEYYIMWDPEDNTTARDVTFQVICPLPIPANDECAGAVALTVNSGATCTVQTAGTIGGATASADDPAPCFGTADD
ncbi:MAG: GEVED domain-containing protein, partial [Flavobacteriales bacterium]